VTGANPPQAAVLATSVIAGLQSVLSAQHASIYGYPLIGVRLAQAGAAGEEIDHAREAEAAHRVTRDALLEQLAALGTPGVASAAEYEPASPVTDLLSAQRCWR
jgi:hypothetical protein